jgi:phospholipid/cholesterol/gamma-HCH transport system substrate-binding protein
MAFSNEFKVGIFVLVAGGLAVWGTKWSVDGLRPKEAVYHLKMAVPSADGLWIQSQVKLAGVEVGAVTDIDVVGDHAEVEFAVREAYQLPIDSEAAIQSSGILGDRYITVFIGDDPKYLKDGDWIKLHGVPPDIEKIEKQVENITADLQAITAILRQEVENDANREHVEATLANVDALSAQLRAIAEENHHDINAIVDSVKRLTTSLEGFTDDTRAGVNQELLKLQDTTDHLNATADNLSSITGKVDDGEGTIGALVNDKKTVELLNDTISNANDVITGFSGMHAEVYYTGRYYVGLGKAPEDPFFYGNPLAGGGSNTIGILLQPQEDFWYNFEINDYPQGTVNYTEHYFPETGEVYTEYVREPDYRLTFQMNKRWRNFALRLGVKEDGGGVGATVFLAHDKFELQGDIFDFDLGSYPVNNGLPNMRINARWIPHDHVYLDVGTEQLALDLKYGFATMFVGAGFHFSDDDIKLLFATLPLSF